MPVKSTKVEDGKNAVPLKSYEGKIAPDPFADWKIWEVARATSAAPVYFDSFKRKDIEYVDGGMGFNCPVLELFAETNNAIAGAIGRGIRSVVSLGTGVPAAMDYKPGIAGIEGWISIATNSEHAARVAGPIYKGWPQAGEDKFHRLNLSKALSDNDTVMKHFKAKHFWQSDTQKEIGYEQVMGTMDDWKSIGLIRELTNKWLERPETQEEIKKIARSSPEMKLYT